MHDFDKRKFKKNQIWQRVKKSDKGAKNLTASKKRWRGVTNNRHAFDVAPLTDFLHAPLNADFTFMIFLFLKNGIQKIKVRVKLVVNIRLLFKL